MEDQSKHINKRHNVSLLIYHFFCPAKYRKFVFGNKVDNALQEVYLGIEKRYESKYSMKNTEIEK